MLKHTLKRLLAGTGRDDGPHGDGTAAQAADTIKVGVLHSLSGTMAISETTLKDTVLMMIESRTRRAACWARSSKPWSSTRPPTGRCSRRRPRELLTRTRSTWCSAAGPACRASPCCRCSEELNGLLFYPVQYEGEESSKNVFYTGAAPNQQAIPAVDYLMKDIGVKRWVLRGTDYVYPRTTNKILEAYLKAKGVAPTDIMINYTPFGHSDWQTHRGRHQEVRLGRQEDRGGLDHQRRRQRAVLQGARQPEDLGRRHSGGGVLGG